MNHMQSHSKIYLLLIVLILASGIALLAAQETHATGLTNLEGSVLREDNISPVDFRLPGPFGVDGFAQIQGTAFQVDTHLPGPSGVDGFTQIKATAFPVDAHLLGPSGVDEVQQVNGNLMP